MKERMEELRKEINYLQKAIDHLIEMTTWQQFYHHKEDNDLTSAKTGKMNKSIL